MTVLSFSQYRFYYLLIIVKKIDKIGFYRIEIKIKKISYKNITIKKNKFYLPSIIFIFFLIHSTQFNQFIL